MLAGVKVPPTTDRRLVAAIRLYVEEHGRPGVVSVAELADRYGGPERRAATAYLKQSGQRRHRPGLREVWRLLGGEAWGPCPTMDRGVIMLPRDPRLAPARSYSK